MNSFAKQVVLITGAASGIGRQLALTLSSEGAHIAGLDLQADALGALKSQLKNPCATAVADVTDLAGMRAAVKSLESQLGPTDVLIANAGIGRETPAAAFSGEDIGAQIQVNLVGVVNSIAAVMPTMRQRGQGHLVAISSLASYRGLPLMAGYCASKAGVNALMDSLRVELRPLGIHVTTICPGWIRTPLTESAKVPKLNMMDVESAVTRMVKAIRSRRPFVAFPAGDAWQVRLLRYLPRSLSDWLVKRFLARMRK
jgi:short-subunit dehydrogenase